jgi:hypothetical protein
MTTLSTPIRASQPDLNVKLDVGGAVTPHIAAVATRAKSAHESGVGIIALSTTIIGIYVQRGHIHQLNKLHHVAHVIRLCTTV